MKHKGIFSLLSVLLASSMLLTTVHHASANQELKNKINHVKEQRSDLKGDKNEVQSMIGQNKEEQAKLNQEIKRIDMQISEAKTNIINKEGEITQTKADIEKLNHEIAELKERIAQRDEILKARVRSVQQNGGNVSYLDVLLGAKNIGDFLDRVSSVTTIVAHDKDILRKHIEEKQLVEEKKVEVTALLAQKEQQLIELEQLKASYLANKDKKKEMMAVLKTKEDQLEEDLLEIEEQDEILSKQEQAYKKLYQQWLEAERRRKEAIAKGQKPPVTDGTFMRPTMGPVTSNYGQRWGRLHAGIDIGKRGSDVPVVAVADGIVFRSYYSSSYGNVVFISHNVNGQMYTTLYAHLENRQVQEGQVVTKGQTLGRMGNTGRSFGAHLHFEIHKGPWNSSKSNSVDPRKYINF